MLRTWKIHPPVYRDEVRGDGRPGRLLNPDGDGRGGGGFDGEGKGQGYGSSRGGGFGDGMRADGDGDGYSNCWRELC